MRATLVIPCLNEAGAIQELVARVEDSLPNDLVEVVFVDNGSTDDTRERLMLAIGNHPQMWVLSLDQNLGYGGGIKAGISAARGQVLAWTHADLQSDPALAWQAISLVESSQEVSVAKGRRTKRRTLDVFFTWGMSLLIASMFGVWLRDINGQPTAIPGSLKPEVINGPDDFSLDLHVLVQAQRRRVPVLRFTAPFGSRKHGVSSWNNGWTSRLRMIRRVTSYALELRRRGVNANHSAQGK